MRTLTLLLAAVALAPGGAAAADISGAWKLSVSLAGQTIPVACAFAQADKALTGTCNRSDLADPPSAVTGSVDGAAVKFGYDVSFNGNPLHLDYTGTVASGAAMSGNVVVANVTGSFAGARP